MPVRHQDSREVIDMERVKIGIKELDDVFEGVPSGRTTLVTGEAGCGKTVLGLQFARSGCEQGMKTVYLSSEETAADLRLQCTALGWDLEKKGLLTFVELLGKRTKQIELSVRIGSDVAKGNFAGLIDHIPEGTQLLVIDSLGPYAADVTAYDFKDQFDLLLYNLSERGITCLVILDAATSKHFDDMAMYSVYGAIRLLRRDNPFTGRRERAMEIVKMRSTATPVDLLSYKIGKGGIKLTTQIEMDE